MTIWRVASVEDQPIMRLDCWRVYEVTTKRERSRHFVGRCAHEYTGRVSSMVVGFDKGVGVTKSGRVYRLLGEPGYSREAGYVWFRWKETCGATDEIDVTNEYACMTTREDE